MNENKETALRYLRPLFFIELAGCLLAALALIATLVPFSVGIWYNWVQRAVALGAAVCLFLLPGRYRYAGMVKVLGLVCSLVSLVLFRLLYAYGLQLDAVVYGGAINWLSGGATVLGFVALFLEYTTHAQIAPGEKAKWYILLGCSLAVSLISSVAVWLLQPLMDQMVQAGELWLIKLWNILSHSLSLGVSVIYLVLLHRTIRIHREE